MLIPRFTIRTALAIVTGCAVLFLIAGTAYRGQDWAWGVVIGVASLALTALVHAAWFGVVWLFSQLPSTRKDEVGGSPVAELAARGFGAASLADSEDRRRHETMGEATN